MANDWGAPAFNEAPADAWGGDAKGTSATNGDGGFAATNGDGFGAASAGDVALAVEDAAAKQKREEYEKKARDAGWTEKTAFDYDEFLRSGGDSGDWNGSTAKYEWKDEYGDVAPRVPELEKQLFGGEFQMRRGDHMANLEGISVDILGPENLKIDNFEDAGLHPAVLENIKLANYVTPTPIQMYTIPAVLKGRDVVAIAQTGSGKTSAYMIPVVSKLMGKAKKLTAPKPDSTARDFDPRRHGVRAEPLVVIVVPTRELAVQIFNEACRMCYRSMLRPCVAYGGWPLGQNIDDLRKGCDILIATPGRLCDLMNKPNIITMSRVKHTIIDEADELLDADWQEELQKIMSGGDSNENADHTFMMFSATFKKEARALSRQWMADDHVRIRVGRAGQAHKNIRQNVLWVDQDRKRDAVFDLLFQMKPGRTIIFCNSKAQVDLLDDFLYNRQLPTTSIHADRNQREREDSMRNFRTGRAPILVATGISARGWDIKDVVHIINFDLPSGMHGGITEYVHRIGRTARIGHEGLATSFYNDRNEDIAQELVNVLVECECEVPDFLSHLKPDEGAALQFDDDTDDEADADDGAAEERFGGGCAPVTAGWGAEPAGGADMRFTADAGFTADGGAASDW